MQYSDVFNYIDSHHEQFLTELSEAVALPSVSVTNTGIHEMCQMVADKLRSLGFSVDVIPTKNSPAIIAERKGTSDRSILFYNHYDVQLGEPLDAWVTPPFEPDVRDGVFYGRGAMDDKGHLYCRIAAVESLLKTYGELPCTVKFFVEGEEEIGSPNLREVVVANAERLKSDLCLWEFGDVDPEGYSISYLGFRGILIVQWDLKTSKGDGHSGIWGGVQPNAIWRMVWALNRMKTPDGIVHIPGFYDGIVPPTESDMKYIHLLPPMRESMKSILECRELATGAKDGAELFIASMMIPTCNINGISGGYEGKGAKPAVPCKATVKTDFRLVPGQDPDDILRKLRSFLDSIGCDDIELMPLMKLKPSQTPSNHPFVEMLSQSAEAVYKKPQRVYPMSGGSGPSDLFSNVAATPIFTAGVGNQDSSIHGPNENIRLIDFYNGIKHTAAICIDLGRYSK